MNPIHVFGVLFLIGVNGFFAAAEFSLVAVRLSRVRQLVEAGDARAKIVLDLLAHPDRIVSGVQVGMTITSLGLGAVGELTLASLLRPLVASIPERHAVVVAHG